MKLPAHKKMLSAAAAASVLLLTAACGSSDEPTSETSTSSAPEAGDASGDDTSADDGAATYKDGDYEASAGYSNPGGESEVKVEVTLAANKITEVTVTPLAENGTSKQYQEKFAGGISDEVVGKSLDELDVSKVAGSSLTSSGFNAAIDDIKADAQA
ncbi:FMN-binding protein [Aeromicrobium sp. NPDC092404]|uniref:FMN-binding protein n=1 Tax=Aeromicrobium sp. NPDC092404 TaxID=3154976 RepID=UPI0034462AB0